MTNALVRRVRRHASISVLNRSPDPALIKPAPYMGQSTGFNQQNRAVIQASLVPAGSSLPFGLALADVGGGQSLFTPPLVGADLLPPEADIESQSRLTPASLRTIQRAQAEQQSEQAPRLSKQTSQPGEQAPVITSISSPGGSTISGSEWARLKSFMEGHQEKIAREKAEQEASGSVQLSPEEEAQQEAKRKAQEEIVRRQTLAQSGQRPKAKVVYLSSEDKKVEDEPLVAKAADTPALEDESEADVEKPPTQPDISLESDIVPEEPVEDSYEQVKPLEARTAATERELPAELEEKPESISSLEQADLPQEDTTAIPVSPNDLSIKKSQIQAKGSDKKTGTQSAEIESEPEIPREPAESSQLTPSREETSLASDEPATETDPDYQEVSNISEDSKTAGLGGRLFRAVKSLIGSEPDDLPTTPSVIQKKQGAERSTAEQLPTSPPETRPPKADPADFALDEIITPELDASPDDSADESDLFEISPEVTGADLEHGPGAGGRVSDQVTQSVSDSTSSIQRSLEKTASRPGPVDTAEATPESSYEAGDHEPDVPARTVIDSMGVVQKSSEQAPSGKGVQSDPGQAVEKHQPIEPTQTEQPLPRRELPEEPAAEQIPGPVKSLSKGTEPEAETETGQTLESGNTVVADLARSSEPTSSPADVLYPLEISEQGLYGPAELAIDDTDETVIQQMPLDKVWPMQQSRDSKRTKPDTKEVPSFNPSASSESRTQGPVIQRMVAPGDAVSDQIEEVLGEVVPGEVSDSSIELVLPRRPRPAPIAGNLPTTVQAEKGGPERVEHQEISDQVPAQAESSRPSDFQKQLREDAKPHDMIPTDIGPLPADLWQILGQSPPEIPSRQPAEKSPPAQASVQRANEAVETTPTRPLEPTPQMTDLARELVMPAVQRVDAGSQVSDVSDSSEADGESSEDSEEEDSEANIDKLARQVYPIVERMLALERERSRGRF